MNRDIWEYIKEESKVGDGEYALIDNYRNQIDGIFHEQWFYCKNRAHDRGREFELALSKAGWHGDNWEFAPLNVASISAELYADVVDYNNFNIGAGASVSALEIEHSKVIGDYKVTISFGFGAGGGFSFNRKDGQFIEGTIAPSTSPISLSWERVE
jgi:hypothetical protein